MRCIEILRDFELADAIYMINRNMRCIEMIHRRSEKISKFG